jgi:hypothetical protein
MKTYHEKVWICTIIVTFILFFLTFSFAQAESIKGGQFKDGSIIYGKVITMNLDEIQIEMEDGKIISRKYDDVAIIINNTGVDAKKESNTTVENSPSAGMVVLDLFFVRPPCVVGALISTAVWIVTILPVHVIGASEQWYLLAVEAPWRFVNARPLGEFTTYRDGKPITVIKR